ncbi:hypothetical protein AGR7A_Lc10052 [Agrobacterium deltaense NCPPB 1641]|uniref:Transposase n=1 Tax=Agrobacterium deltaense NCPPB 1641 TaxID=1183425 RepID=A0A1S7TSU9_9HYPH|nr:hypothetical protein AGR7A_Lc10052 [Agrobacterium deltaense NCPPB 1641]
MASDERWIVYLGVICWRWHQEKLSKSGVLWIHFSDPLSLFPDVSGLCETLKWQYGLLA